MSTNTNEEKKQQVPETKHSINSLPTFGQDGIEIENDDTWLVHDLYIKDMHGIVRETVSRTKLYPIRTSEGELYPTESREIYFKKGSGLLMLQRIDSTDIREIQPESFCFIDKGTWHQIINTSKNEDIFYEIRHPSKLEPTRFKEQKRRIFSSNSNIGESSNKKQRR